MANGNDIHARVVHVYRSVSPGGRAPAKSGQGELDSMGFLEFLAGLEREFGLVLEPEEITEANFGTTEATVAFIGQKLSPG